MKMTSYEEEILNILENGQYSVDTCVDDVRDKLAEFLNFFNSTARLTMMHANKVDSEEIIYLLFTLMKSISEAIPDIGKAHSKICLNLSCPECAKIINTDSTNDIWRSFQDHEHIENLYFQFLNGSDLTFTAIPNKAPMGHRDDGHNSSVDNDIEHTHDVNFDHTNEEVHSHSDSQVEDVNSFRFNFKLQLDDTVESKIYPKSLITITQRLDKCNYNTIQRTGQIRAVCLLCCKELMSRVKVSRVFLQEHVIGQRHLALTKTEANLSTLRIYHETWQGIEMPHQSHQIFFIPVIPSSIQCVLCGYHIPCSHQAVYSHIALNGHKERVLHLFTSRMENLFYLLDKAVEVYGEPKKLKEKVADKSNKKKENKPVKNNVPKPASSDSKDSTKPSHNIIKAIDNDKKGPNALEMIPNRFRKSFDLLSNRSTFCRLCKIKFHSVELLKKHIEQPTHIYSSKSPLMRYNYYCEICNERIKDELHWQKHFRDGPNQHQNMADSRKNRVTEYECTVCSAVIFGDELSLSRHLATRGKKVKNKLQLSDKVIKLLASKNDIEAECQKMAQEANDTLNDEVAMACCKRIETALGPIFNECKAYPFGSRVSGLGHKASDLDIFIDIGDMYTGGKKQDTQSQVLIVRKAAAALQKNKEEFSEVFTIATARTPIVRVIHELTSIDCDLSFRHGLSVENTKFLKFCIDIQPITQPFVLLLKKWSEMNNMREHMSNYAMTIMAIFYLQLNGYLLSVKKIRQYNPSPPIVINGWETLIYSVPLDVMKGYVKPYEFTIVKLLADFFQYYSKFNYSAHVVCPLLGHAIKKDLFKGPREHLIPDMKSYVDQLDGEEAEEFRCLSVFCVQDPFDLSHNLTKAWQSGVLNRFKELCELTYKHLIDLK